MNRIGSVTESAFLGVNEGFTGTLRPNPALRTIYAVGSPHGSGGWFLWPVTSTFVKFFSRR